MRKLSILLVLIGITFMTMEANNPPAQRPRILRWRHQQKALIPIPVEAYQNESSIEIRFLSKVDNSIIFQVKDQHGNTIFQDMVIPNELENYKIDLESFTMGHYELLYIGEDMTLIGEFDIEYPNPQ